MILQSWTEAEELTFQNYFYYMLAKRVENRMENFSVLAEGGRRKTQNFKHPISQITHSKRGTLF